MNAKDLFCAIGEINVDLLTDIETVAPQQKNIVWLRFGAVAAFAVLAIAALFSVFVSIKNPPTTQGPSSSSEDASVVSSLIPINSEELSENTIKNPFSNRRYNNYTFVSAWKDTTYYTFGDLLELSEELVTVNVLGQYYDPESRFFYAKVKVESPLKFSEVLHGGEVLYVKDNGWGELNEDGQISQAQTEGGGLLMETGNRVMLFLDSTGKCIEECAVYQLTVGAVSKFYYGNNALFYPSSHFQPQGSDNHYPDMLTDYEPSALWELKFEYGDKYGFGLGYYYYPDHGPW